MFGVGSDEIRMLGMGSDEIIKLGMGSDEIMKLGMGSVGNYFIIYNTVDSVYLARDNPHYCKQLHIYNLIFGIVSREFFMLE